MLCTAPPPYTEPIHLSDNMPPKRVVMRDGRVLNEGEIVPMYDDNNKVITYTEVRENGELWVNVTVLAKHSGTKKTWSGWYQNESTRELLEVIQKNNKTILC